MLRGCSSASRLYTLRDTIRRSSAPCTWCCELPPGDADVLSGRYLSVDDDLDALVKQSADEPSADQRMLRINGVAAFSG